MTGALSYPSCSGSHVIVIDSRKSTEGTFRWRRCLDCKHRWKTIEIPVTTTNRDELNVLLSKALQTQAAVDRLVDALRAAGVRTIE